MLLKVPFYKNDAEGIQCLQVAMQIVLKYYLNKEYSLKELDKLTGRKKGFWTWTPQIITVLFDLGLDSIYYSKTPLEPFLKGESFIREHFGQKDAEEMIKNSDIPVIVESIKKTLDYSLFQTKDLQIADLEKALDNNQLPMVMIDYNKLILKDEPYSGHFIVLTGYDAENIFYHESGPRDIEPNRKISKEDFLRAWEANGTDKDCIIIRGKR